jgi:uncharacterized membrane protein YedE/YeeE
MRVIAALISGLLFGLGLTISGMINPAKVLGFLDAAGDWDPSLSLVMAAAIPIAAIGFAIGRRREAPLCAKEFVLPTKTAVDARLVAGALTFGVGWGLAGYCPGPALASLAFAGLRSLVFVAAMVVGMAVFRLMSTPDPKRRTPAALPSL